MTSAAEYEKKVWAIVETVAKNKKIELHFGTIQEAKYHKARITQMQKELKLVRKDIGVTKKAINSSYTSQKTQVGKGLGTSITAGLFGKKAVGKANAVTRDTLRLAQQNAIRPYENVLRLIDNIIIQLDQLKLQIDSWVIKNS